MKESKEIFKTVVIQHLEVDGDVGSEGRIIVLPCRDEETANQFKAFYAKKFPPTQLLSIDILDTHIYG